MGSLVFWAVLACLGAGVVAAAVVASPGLSQLPVTTITTTGTTATTTTRSHDDDASAASGSDPRGSVVGKVDVGGMTPEGAQVHVQTEFDEPLRLHWGTRRSWSPRCGSARPRGSSWRSIRPAARRRARGLRSSSTSAPEESRAT